MNNRSADHKGKLTSIKHLDNRRTGHCPDRHTCRGHTRHSSPDPRRLRRYPPHTPDKTKHRDWAGTCLARTARNSKRPSRLNTSRQRTVPHKDRSTRQERPLHQSAKQKDGERIMHLSAYLRTCTLAQRSIGCAHTANAASRRIQRFLKRTRRTRHALGPTTARSVLACNNQVSAHFT
jgi:hypothetical protein